MTLALVELPCAPGDIGAAMRHLKLCAPQVRAMAGNISFRAFATPNSVLIVHEWADAATFDAYRATAVFAEMGAVLKPLASAAPISRAFAEHVAS